jgi:hypothetical protein
VGAQDAATARAVRLSSVDGQVQIAQGGQVLADSALANTPLFEGTQVSTSEGGRAEIQFEDGSVARLSPNSSLTLTVLRGQNGSTDTEMELEGGLAYFELQAGSDSGRMRIRFSGSVVTAEGFSVLRVNLDNPPGELAVFSGNAHLERAPVLALDLRGGESVALNDANPGQYKLAESIEPDSWDVWNADRDQALTAAAATQTGATKSFNNSNNPAWSDLDANGNWYDVPGQGYVWSPFEATNAGWDPYGCGHWVWTPNAGYIWVSCSSWGYMPFQCGAWNFYDSFGWGWAPGMGVCRPWWGGGQYGLNIGSYPPGYRLPRLPRAPIHRIGVGGGRSGPIPLIAVNRGPAMGIVGPVARDRNTPIVIAGHSVQPLRPLAPRLPYDHPAPIFVNRSQPTYLGSGTGGAVRPGYAPGSNPGANQRNGNATGATPYYNTGAHAFAPSSHTNSGGGSSSHAPANSSSSGASRGGGSAAGSSSMGSAGGGGGAHIGGGSGNSSSGSHR